MGDSGNGLSFVSWSDARWPGGGLMLPPAKSVRAHEPGLLLLADDDDAFGIFNASDLA